MEKSNKLVIVDEILGQLEAAKSGIVEGSVCMASVSAIDNVASNIVQNVIGGSTSGAYMTFPLSPIVKCCSLDKSYLNLEFDLNYCVQILMKTYAAADATETLEADFPMYVGFRDTNTIFDQVQLMIENTPIYTDSYNRENATFLYCSLPEGVIRDGVQYASIDKMRNGDKSPMKRIIVHGKTVHTQNVSTVAFVCPITMHIRATVDVSRMPQVILSNLHYTTPHFGNLRLRVFIQKIQEALLFCPDYSWMDLKTAADATVLGGLTPFMNAYWTYYSFNEYVGSTTSVIGAAPGQATGLEGGSTVGEIPLYGYNASGVINAASIRFLNHSRYPSAISTTGADIDQMPFMTFTGNSSVAEMVQTCFDIKGEEYDQLTKYFEEMGSIIIPTQVLSCSVFNNSNISGKAPTGPMIANVGSYNINDICVYFHNTKCPVMFNNEALTNIQLLLDGRPINNIPYQYLNDKAITQMTQSIIDTDHEDINRDYMRSLSWLNYTDTSKYLSVPLHTTLGTGEVGTGSRRIGTYNPGLCAYVFNCNLDDAFHSGWACLETATRNAVLRLDCSSAQSDNTACFGDGTQGSANRHLYPSYQTSNRYGTSTTVGFICFCDTCLVLDYDRARGIAVSGSLSNAAPYV